MAGRSTVRALAWFALGAQVAFVVAWVVAGALQRGYDHATQGVSYLAADGADHPWIVTAGLLLLAASFGALAAGLMRTLPRRRALAVAAFGGVAVTVVLSAVFRLDCGATDLERCEDLWEAGRLTWQHDAHLWVGLATSLLLLLTPFALARALAPGTVATVAISAGAVGVLIAIATHVAYLIPGLGHGLVQRAGLAVVHVWVFIVAVGILHATRGRPRTSDLITMRPRDFLARAWTGEAQLMLRPFFLGRLFAQRGEAHRESTWISERVWRIDDRVDFGGGRVERRFMYCEFVTADHGRLTADDLPDGADVWLEEDGWRVPEFRIAWPVGPLPLVMWCADRSYIAPDGTFVNRFDIYPLGVRIPLARVTFRMRPAVSQAEAGEREAVGLT